ncbi:TPA: hypothetical protein ACN35C_004728 [Vibrio parahaemolyticus]
MTSTIQPSRKKILSKLSLAFLIGINLSVFGCLIYSAYSFGTNNPWIIDILPIAIMSILLIHQFLVASPVYTHYFKDILSKHIHSIFITPLFYVFATTFNLHLNKGYDMSFFSPAYIFGFGLAGIAMVISYLKYEENSYVNKEESIDLRKLL